jgi:hypothetical protein
VLIFIAVIRVAGFFPAERSDSSKYLPELIFDEYHRDEFDAFFVFLGSLD